MPAKLYNKFCEKKLCKKYRTQKIFFLLLACVLLIIPKTPAKAQGGSNYSIFGIGDLIYGGSAAYQAIGGTQVAVPTTNNINMLNPAMWSLVDMTRLQTGYRFNQNVLSTETSELWQNNGGLNGFSSIFNFDTARKISAVIMFQPMSTVNYFMSSPIKIKNDEISIEGKNTYKGSGGLSSLTLGLGGKISDCWYFGGSFSGVFGKISHNSTAEFSTSYTTNYEINYIDDIETYSYKIGTYFSPTEKLGIGLFYEYLRDANLNVRSEYTYGASLGNSVEGPLIDKKTTNTYSKEKMPQYFGVGVSYVLGKFMLAGDFIRGTFSNLSINKGVNTEFRDMQRISLGAATMPNPNPYAPLYEQISYKFGGYYEQLYYAINGFNMNEFAITAGIHYPISRNAQIDFALVAGARGTTERGLAREQFVKMIIDISIGDIWFQKIRR